jgi:hypothetical protein
MKLKEKFAERQALNDWAAPPEILDVIVRAYLAGFEKARELAVEYIAIRSNESDGLCPEMREIGEEEAK